MSSRFDLQKPYTVATLPRPMDHSKGHYVVGEVFGGVPGSRKRKRSELVVGIDGEGVNIYDIKASKLITSYALPPESAFTCPPTCSRTRASKSLIERRTYVSMTNPKPQIISFYESIQGIGSSESRSASCNVEGSQSPVVFLGTIASTKGTDTTSRSSDLIVVKEDGEIQCVDGEVLHEKWTSPASALFRDSTASVRNTKVEYTTLTDAYSTSQGMLKGREDVLALFTQEITKDGFNPELLVIITTSGKKSTSRTLHVVSFPRIATSETHKHSVELLLSVPIPVNDEHSAGKCKLSYNIQASTGSLQQLAHDTLTTYDLTHTLPKEESKINVSDAQSFLRLSNTSIMMSSADSISVYNPKYRSRLATIPFDISGKSDLLKRKRSNHDGTNGIMHHKCQLVSYFPKLGAVMAIVDNNLVGIQVASQRDRYGKTQATGLLIDSLRCSIPCDEKSNLKEFKAINFLTMQSSGALGSSGAKADQTWASLIAPIEEVFAKGECSESKFDQFMGQYLDLSTNVDEKGQKPKVEVDRRWVIYALSKIFKYTEANDGILELSIAFYAEETFWALLQRGFLTVENIESALHYENSTPQSLSPGQLVKVLVDLDPDMNMLIAAIGKNHYSAAELLFAIRELMESLALMGETPAKMELLKNGVVEDSAMAADDLDKEIEKLEEQAEAEIERAEYQIGAGSDYRAMGLSRSLDKLYRCPDEAIVHALQKHYSSKEIVSLIYLLRYELADGGWVTEYVGREDEGLDDAEAPINAIVLLSTLFNCCVDAIGAGGWMSGEARLVDDDPFEAEDLVHMLRNEIEGVAEGVNGAIYMGSFLSEYLRYASRVQKGLESAQWKRALVADIQNDMRWIKPVTMSLAPETLMVPLGGKVEKSVSNLKITAMGDINERSRRDLGDQKSRRVGKYTRERINV